METDDEDEVVFWKLLPSVLEWIPKHDLQVVIGDFNANTGGNNKNSGRQDRWEK